MHRKKLPQQLKQIDKQLQKQSKETKIYSINDKERSLNQMKLTDWRKISLNDTRDDNIYTGTDIVRVRVWRWIYGNWEIEAAQSAYCLPFCFGVNSYKINVFISE